MHCRFQELINRPEYVVGTILDWRHKLVPFPERDLFDSEESDENFDYVGAISSSKLETLQRISRTEARRMLLQMTGAATAGAGASGIGCATTSKASRESAVTKHSQPGSSRKSIFSLFSASLQVVCSNTEDNQYCNSPTDGEILPEVYWARMSGSFPRLVAMLAQTLLSTPASSGGVELLFSVSGAIVRASRSRLTATTVESLLMAMEYE